MFYGERRLSLATLTIEKAKLYADRYTLGFFEELSPNVVFETPELEAKIKAYIKAKKELKELLDIDR